MDEPPQAVLRLLPNQVSLFWLCIVGGIFIIESWETLPFLETTTDAGLRVSWSSGAAIAAAATLRKLIIPLLLIDFLSCCLSRSLVRWSLPKSAAIVIALPFIDLCLSVALFMLLYIPLSIAVTGRSDISTHPLALIQTATLFGYTFELNDVNPNMVDPISQSHAFVFVGSDSVFLYSSLLTSLWLWLYVVSYISLFFGIAFDRVKSSTLRHLNLSEKPAHAIGFLLITFASVAGLIYALIKTVIGF